MSKSKIFFLSLLFFILGIFLGRYVVLSFSLKAFLFLILVFLISLGWRDLNLRSLSFFGLFLLLGISHWQSFDSHSLAKDKIRFYHNQKIVFQGVIISEPEIKKDKQRFTIRAEKIKLVDQEEWQETSGKVLITKLRYPEYSYGDLIDLKCFLRSPSLKIKEQESNFDYSNYLSQFKIYSTCFYPEVKLIKKNQGNPVYSLILKLKKKFEEGFDQILPSPQSSFLAGLLIGSRKTLSQDLLDVFNTVGITHIIAISGFNISIIAWFIGSIFEGWFSRKISFVFCLILIGFFIVLTGAQASVIRAGIMAIFVLLAGSFNRLSMIRNALVFACAIMLFLNPKILFFDLGFQLSFLSTCGLIWLVPLLERYFQFIPRFLKLREYGLATFSALIMVVPLIAYNFGRISLIAPLANILVLPLIPITMFFGFISGLLGMVVLPLGKIVGLISYALLSYILEIAKFCSKIPFASLEIKDFSLISMIICYLFIFLGIYLLKKIRQPREFL